MTTPFAVDRAVSFKFRLVGRRLPYRNHSQTVGSSSNALCPRVPDGYYAISKAQHDDQDVEIGEQVVNQYGDSFDQRNLQSRAPASFDPRPSQVTSRKDQSTTGLCGKLRFTSL
jgi:hypothetical protein